MVGFWKARRARKLAAAAIVPFVGQTRLRLGDIPDRVWSGAYVIGFIGTLITLVAERQVGSMSDDALASVQTGAWSDITRTEGILLGEEICFLSTAGDRTFELGCSNATSFFEAFTVSGSGFATGLSDNAGASEPPDHAGGADASELWIRYFDAYLDLMPTAGT